MKTFTITILLCLMIPACLSSVPGFKSTVWKLHQRAVVSCDGNCSGSVTWTKIQKPSGDAVVARCDQTSCSSEDGFIVSPGNLSLTVTAADYSRRGWYRCQCDGGEVCVVSLGIAPVEVLKRISPGDPLVMDVPIPERVALILHRSGDDDDDDDGDGGAQSSVSVPVCTVEGRKVQCEAEFEKRVSLKCSLGLSAVSQTDGGVYTVWDTDNDELMATYTLTGNGSDGNYTLPATGKQDSGNLKRIFLEEWRGIILGLCLGLVLFGAPWIVNSCMILRQKVKRCWRGDRGQQKVMSDDLETIKLSVDTVGSVG